MATLRFLDLLDDFLVERDAAFAALSRANLQLTRFKLNHGIDSFISVEDSVYDSDSVNVNVTASTNDTLIIRNRYKQEGAINNTHETHENARISTKMDQVNELKGIFRSVLQERLIPLAYMLSKLNTNMKE